MRFKNLTILLIFALLWLPVGAIGETWDVPDIDFNPSDVSTSSGSNTVTLSKGGDSGTFEIRMTWTSTSGGAVSTTLPRIFGTIERIAFAPVASASPTNNYDITITDWVGVDVTQGEGTNLSATVAADVVPLVATTVESGTSYQGTKVAVAGDLNFVVANAGNAKQGKCAIIIRP